MSSIGLAALPVTVRSLALRLSGLQGRRQQLLHQLSHERGLLNPITLAGRQVLDGRNRLSACRLAGVKPRFEEWSDPGCGPVAWVISQNLHRRHLNESQRAMIADSLATLRLSGQ
jgi:hypothetical protein